MTDRLLRVCLLVSFCFSTDWTFAQMVQSASPQQNIGSSFFEQSGLHWSLGGANFAANSGGGVLAPFGNPNPGAGLSTGIGFAGGGVSGSLGFNFAQGSSRSVTSTTPSVTTLNGYPGSISSGIVRPFVTGVTPVIGGYSYGQPIRDNASSQLFQSQQHAQALQLQSRLQANQQSQQSKATEAFERAIRAESDGDLRTARANYRKALAMDQGPLRSQILQKMQSRGWK